MNNRIKEVRNHFGLTQQEFADKIKVKRNTVATYEMGRSTPSDSALSLICKEFNVNEEWLRYGTGEKYIPISKSDQIADMISEVMKADDESFKRRLISALSMLDESGWENLEKLIDMISSKK